MLDRATRWFLRFRDHGDAKALGRVFDRVAPELLRIARNLAGNIVDAEDLVQATFLSAIESAGRFARDRRVEPWLVAILTHHAHAERRRRQRTAADGGEPDMQSAADAGPGERAAASELAAQSRAMLERLPEPYRQPTLLRIAHGLPPAEIALLLGRSRGTVRAQIHRGLEQLRQRLPAGAFAGLFGSDLFGSDLVGSDLLGRGLLAVKTTVLAHAARHAATAVAAGGATAGVAATGATLTGAFVMSKKTLAAALLVLAGLTFAIARSGTAPGSSPDTGGSGAAVAANAAVAAAPREPSAQDIAAEAAAAPRAPAPYDPGPDAMHLRGRVVDGTSTKPIAGAAIAVFAPRRVTLLDVQREFGAFGWPLPNGVMTSMVEWLRDQPELTAAATANGAPVDYLLPPGPNQTALLETSTDADGCFDVALTRSGAVVAIAHPGHGTRHVPVRKLPLHSDSPPTPDNAAAGAVETLKLWPVRQVEAKVRTADGGEPHERIDLLLTDAAGFPSTGAWLATTDVHGRFAVDVAASKVRVESRSPGWIVRGVASSDDGLPTTQSREIEVGTLATVQVQRFGSARLHVTDADTGRAIGTIRVMATDENEFARWCGTFAAKDGWFALGGFPAEDIAMQRLVGLDSGFPKTLGATVWSPGYVPAAVQDVALYGDNPPVVEVALHRGDVALSAGRVVRGDAPVGGAELQLRLFRRIAWPDSETSAVAVTKSGADGSFAFAVPPRDYLLEVRLGGEVVYQRPTQVPSSTTIDLDAAVQVTVEVVDADGRPVAGHNCMVTNGSGNQRAGRTGSDGRASFGPFAAGELTAWAPRKATDGSWAGEIKASVDAGPGARPVVQLRLPRDERFRVQLAFDGPAPAHGFAGFTASNASYGERSSDVAVEPGGGVPIDVGAGAKLQVKAPDGRQWRLQLPAELHANPTLLLRWSGLGYAGVLTDDDGRPIAQGRVFATPVGLESTISVTTDKDGAFTLDGLEARRYEVTFHSDAGAPFREWHGNRLAMAFFEPAQLPASPHAHLNVRVPHAAVSSDAEGATVAVTVHVRDADGHPVAGAMTSVTTLFDRSDGVLQLYSNKSWQYADSAGSTQFAVTRGDRYRGYVARANGDAPHTEEWSLPANAASDERSIVLR